MQLRQPLEAALILLEKVIAWASTGSLLSVQESPDRAADNEGHFSRAANSLESTLARLLIIEENVAELLIMESILAALLFIEEDVAGPLTMKTICHGC